MIQLAANGTLAHEGVGLAILAGVLLLGALVGPVLRTARFRAVGTADFAVSGGHTLPTIRWIVLHESASSIHVAAADACDASIASSSIFFDIPIAIRSLGNT